MKTENMKKVSESCNDVRVGCLICGLKIDVFPLKKILSSTPDSNPDLLGSKGAPRPQGINIKTCKRTTKRFSQQHFINILKWITEELGLQVC